MLIQHGQGGVDGLARSTSFSSRVCSPVPILEISRISWMMLRRCAPDLLMSLAYSAYLALFIFPSISPPRVSENPRMAFRGVRNSWDMLARKSLLERSEISACSLAASNYRIMGLLTNKKSAVPRPVTMAAMMVARIPAWINGRRISDISILAITPTFLKITTGS